MKKRESILFFLILLSLSAQLRCYSGEQIVAGENDYDKPWRSVKGLTSDCEILTRELPDLNSTSVHGLFYRDYLRRTASCLQACGRLAEAINFYKAAANENDFKANIELKKLGLRYTPSPSRPVRICGWPNSPSVKGFEFGVVNANASHVAGFQLGILSAASFRLDGVQVSLMNSSNVLRGLQLGLLNNYVLPLKPSEPAEISGIQMGLLNYAAKTNGLQIGLFNRSVRLSGLQIGIINWVDEPKLVRFFPVVNASW